MPSASYVSNKLFPLETLPRRMLVRARFEGRRLRPLPGKVDFVVAGFERCGTTTLDGYLREHPEIGMGLRKEVHFFDTERHFRGARPDYRYYHCFYDRRSSIRVRGDATPRYVSFARAPARIRAYNPAMKLILLMRDPAERAYSDWNRSVIEGVEPLSFSEAIRSPREAHRGHWRDRDLELQRWFGYLDGGFYDEQVEYVLGFFPAGQILCLKTEDMARDHQSVLDRVCSFLGVSSHRFAAPRRLNTREYAAPMLEADRDYLREVFEPHVSALERRLGWGCSDWRR